YMDVEAIASGYVVRRHIPDGNVVVARSVGPEGILADRYVIAPAGVAGQRVVPNSGVGVGATGHDARTVARERTLPDRGVAARNGIALQHIHADGRIAAPNGIVQQRLVAASCVPEPDGVELQHAAADGRVPGPIVALQRLVADGCVVAAGD